MSQLTELTVSVVGYQARERDRKSVIGEVEGVRPRGVRIHKIPGHPGHAGYLPVEAIDRVEPRTNTIVVKAGIGLGQVLDAPAPPDESAEGWHKSTDWWADLLGHYGLFEAEGRGNEPSPHSDQR